jgi:hypothetical protein
MNKLKTYEGFFDFLKKNSKRDVTISEIIDCLYDIHDESRIKSEINEDNKPSSGIFHELSDIYHNDINKSEGITVIGKDIATFTIQYSQNDYSSFGWNNFKGISDDEVSTILKNCQNHLSKYDCEMTFFIGKGLGLEGTTWDTEFSDLNKMIKKTVNKTEYKDCIRNITIKIKANGEIS